LENINQTGKLTEKQKEILEKRREELKKEDKMIAWLALCGALLCFSIIGSPIGAIVVLYVIHKDSRTKKELKEIEFQLAGG